ncbi:MAG TPA: alkaline phosphatase family protein [Gemmatimonadaceae bacterium]|nr:alkaline phosphatase family protein [Gemmatimonadaceae bacterium]
MPLFTRRLPRAAALALALLGAAGCSEAHPGATKPGTPAIGHVFVIVLENQGYDTTFGPGTRAPYLADTLPRAGALLHQYYGIGHYSLDNYIAMVSGIAPSPKTQLDCGRYEEFVQTGTAPDGQPIGDGCIYPAHVQTIANQLMAKGLTWKGYMEDMGKDPSREAATCGHAPIGALDPTERAAPQDQYAAKHDPFVYFHAILDSASCQQNVVPLPELETALRTVDQTPNYSFIVPSLCHDGHDRPCKNGEPGGLVSADEFLKHWVPLITNSPAFRKDGLLIVTFDEALSIDATSCCNEQPGPNVQKAGVNGPGGGRTGAVLLSPFIKPGTVSDVPYNHYSMLRSVEDIFGLSHLGYAGQDGLATFGPDVYTQAADAR